MKPFIGVASDLFPIMGYNKKFFALYSIMIGLAGESSDWKCIYSLVRSLTNIHLKRSIYRMRSSISSLPRWCHRAS